VTYYVLFFIHLDSRRVSLAGITDHPEACWMRQVACNGTLEGIGQLNGGRYLLHDRDAKFCSAFRETLAAGGVKCLRLPARSPNLNAFAERWVRSVKEGWDSLLRRRDRRAGCHRSSVASASAVSLSITTGGPHELLDHIGVKPATSSTQPEFERLCGALAAIG
jgi:hypothetical protein